MHALVLRDASKSEDEFVAYERVGSLFATGGEPLLKFLSKQPKYETGRETTLDDALRDSLRFEDSSFPSASSNSFDKTPEHIPDYEIWEHADESSYEDISEQTITII